MVTPRRTNLLPTNLLSFSRFCRFGAFGPGFFLFFSDFLLGKRLAFLLYSPHTAQMNLVSTLHRLDGNGRFNVRPVQCKQYGNNLMRGMRMKLLTWAFVALGLAALTTSLKAQGPYLLFGVTNKVWQYYEEGN